MVPTRRFSFPRFAAGWSMAVLTLTTTLQITAPVVADAYRLPIGIPALCPWPEERLRVSCPPPHMLAGSNPTCLTTVRRDICATL